MSWQSGLDAADMLKAAIKGYALIEDLLDGDLTEDIKAKIKGLAQTIRDGFAHKTTPEVVLAEIAAIASMIVERNASFDARADAKWGPK